MKFLVIGNAARVEKYKPELPITGEVDLVVAERGATDEQILAMASDADFIMADAISPVSRTLIEGMPNLKLIHSEGVAYNAIDVDAAAEHGIPVCNNAGVNASCVAEQAILLMLGCLRDVINCDAAVRAGKQIETKERMMVSGIRELGDCKVGLIGFGAIAQALAERLRPFGCEIVYNKRNPLSVEEEDRLGATFSSIDEILATCDIVSMHVPVTDATQNMADSEFFAKMRPDAVFINTARGEVVDNEALAWALENGQIAAAGLDTVAPEPVKPDNRLLNMPEDALRRVVFSPHIGGVTEGMFYRAHKNVWENVARIAAGENPINQVA